MKRVLVFIKGVLIDGDTKTKKILRVQIKIKKLNKMK